MTSPAHVLYGLPPTELHQPSGKTVQTSPLIPGSQPLEDLAARSAEDVVMLAPAGTVERRHTLALALRTLKPGGTLTVMAAKDKGGSRLRKELEAFGCTVEEWSKSHHRICTLERPEQLEGVEDAVAAGAPRVVPALGLWSQPGVFSWDRLDPGTTALLKVLPALAGVGADLGCGVGVIAQRVLASPKVERLIAIDIDRRAAECARHNLDDPRVQVSWADATAGAPEGLDFVVMNPPFHDASWESKALGQRFIHAAHAALRKGGTLWMVANLHLPYEHVLEPTFARVERRAEGGGYKVYEARR